MSKSLKENFKLDLWKEMSYQVLLSQVTQM